MTTEDQNPPRTEAEAIETAWKIHSALADWTGKVDAKASFALAAESAAIVVTVNLSTAGRALGRFTEFGQFAAFFVGVGALLAAAGMAILAVTPRLRRTHLDDEWRSNFIYFGHLKNWDQDQLASALRQYSPLPMLATQLSNMGKIAWRKHRLVQLSLMMATFATVVLLLLAASA